MVGQNTSIGYEEMAHGNDPNQWRGRELTQGQRRRMKMVAGYKPASALYVKNMAGVAQLASGVARHFNDIMAVVRGYGALIQSRLQKDDPSMSYVEKMLASSQKAADLIRGLLVFTGDEGVSLREIDLNKLIKRSTRFLPEDAKGRVKIKLELSENELVVMADTSRMEEVLKNLIQNALEAMPDGGVLTLKTERSEATMRASFLIKDTGVGMNEETRERMFDPFFTTKDSRLNVGLGLSKVYGIVKQHSGEVSVESRPAHGSAVRIDLPLVRSGRSFGDPIPMPGSIVARRQRLCRVCISDEL